MDKVKLSVHTLSSILKKDRLLHSNINLKILLSMNSITENMLAGMQLQLICLSANNERIGHSSNMWPLESYVGSCIIIASHGNYCTSTPVHGRNKKHS